MTAEETQLRARANKGDEKAQAELCKRIVVKAAARPSWLEETGSVARHAEEVLLDAACGADFVTLQAARAVLATKRRELAGPNPTPLERALADRLALVLTEADLLAARAAAQGELSLEQAAHLERRYARAHSRAMSAARTLAVVRRLAVNMPTVAVQVNMGVSPAEPPRVSAVARDRGSP